MLSTWFHTLFHFRAYSRLAQAGTAKTALFAVYILLVGALAFNIFFSVQLGKRLTPFLREFPELTFERGVLTAPDKAVSVMIPGTPYSIRFDASDSPVPSQREFLNQQIAAFVHADRIYMPTAAGVQSQPVPPQMDGKITPQFLLAHQDDIRRVLQSAAFIVSFAGLLAGLAGSVLLAWAVLSLWNGISRAGAKTSALLRMAVFLQGPACALWLLHLCAGVPLFLFALFILFNIYSQQIFNTFTEV